MSQDKPRTSTAIWLTWIVAVSAASPTLADSVTRSREAVVTPFDDCPCDPSPDPDSALEWDIPEIPLRDAAEAFGGRLGVQVVVDAHDMSLPVGPFRGRFTPRELWSMMMDAGCADARISDTSRTYSASPKPIPGLNDVKTHYELPASPLVDMVLRLGDASKGLPLTIAPALYSQSTVGPIQGYMTMEDALLKVLAQIPDPGYTYLYLESPSEIALISKDVERSRQDLTQGAARAQLCLARVPPKSGSMLVVATHLPALDHDLAGSVVVLDRATIDAMGASTLPELLQFLSQSTFTRSAGYRLNGAQYAEGRGVGAALVLIEDQRTMVSASSLNDAAFDLNTIPLSAVERVEFVPDSGSIVHGVDNAGGIVNLVLRHPEEGVSAEVRYGAARGGSTERRATAIARMPGSESDATLIADYFEVGNLLGHTRSRYSNQDYRRYGGPDLRSLSSSPGNVRSMDGQNLPGFDTPLVGLSPDQANQLTAEPNLASLLQYQSIAPARSRSSLVGKGSMDFDAAQLSGNAIYSRQTTQYTLRPPPVQGAPLAWNHPQNPFDIPVLFFGLLTGMPSQQYETTSELHRASATIDTQKWGWSWQTSLAHTRESYQARITNEIDPFAVVQALDTSDADSALEILAPAPGADRTDLLAASTTHHSLAKASQLHTQAERGFPLLPAGDMLAKIGAEWRKEVIDFDEVDEDTGRTVRSGFLDLQIPLIDSFVLRGGLRHDWYSDSESVTSHQFGFDWNPIRLLTLRGEFGERFRPPSLYELHLRPISIDMPVLDPKTQQTTVARIVGGGGHGLAPTTATSSRLGFSLTPAGDWQASLDYWQVRIDDRIGTLPLAATLAHEDYLPGSVTRGMAVAEDLPGPIETIDLGWRNLGELRASGVDFALRTDTPVAGGRLTTRLAVTWNASFSFRDLPPEVSPLINRVGVASELGTIPRYRAITSLMWENTSWRVAAHVQHHPHYRDVTWGNEGNSYVSAQTIVGLNVARRVGAATIQLGASNLFDSEPDYSNIYGAGYDPSQGDMRGRFVFGEIRVEF